MSRNATQEYEIAAADALTAWCRGDIAATGRESAAVVVVSGRAGVDWLLAEGGALIGPATTVIAGDAGGDTDLPEAWTPAAGTVSELGGELRLGEDFFLHSTEYASLRYMSVIGPTVVRLTCAEDVADLFADIALAHATGSLPQALRHPLVELGDHCALGHPCAGRILRRLHIDGAGVVRTSPFGATLGAIDDDVEVLRACARDLPADPCVTAEAAAALAARDLAPARQFAAALEAIRVLTLSGREDWSPASDWRVSGIGFQLAQDDGPMPAGSELLILVAGEHHVLFERATRRAFRVSRIVALVTELLLAESDEPKAAARLSGAVAPDPAALATVRRVRQGITDLGVTLDV